MESDDVVSVDYSFSATLQVAADESDLLTRALLDTDCCAAGPSDTCGLRGLCFGLPARLHGACRGRIWCLDNN